MTLPGPTGGTYGPNQNLQLSWLDQTFAAVGALGVIPCIASGSNSITLTPNPNTPAVSGYVNYNQFSFVAVATSTGLVSCQVAGSPLLPLYSQGSTTQQAGANAIVSGFFYTIAYNSALGAGGGFVLISQTSLPGQYLKRNFGAIGGAGRVYDAVITSGSPTVTSASSGFANAVTGMFAAVLDGGVSNALGRPNTLITPLTFVNAQTITLASAPLQNSNVSFTATVVSGSAVLTHLNINPSVAGVRISAVLSGAGVAGLTVVQTSSSKIQMSAITSFSGGNVAIVAQSTTTVLFGYDDGPAFTSALTQGASGYRSALYIEPDNYLIMSGGQAIGGTSNAPHTIVPIGDPLVMFALGSNSASCWTVAGYDLGEAQPQLGGQRYAPINIGYFETDCGNTGLDGVQTGPMTTSNIAMRVVNPYRNMLADTLTSGNSWQERNSVYVTGAMIGHHMHAKTNLASAYQNISTYLIEGRYCGLNSGLILGTATVTSQLGGAVWLFDGGGASGGGVGIRTNTWSDNCEFDGGRAFALSYGSDNNPCAWSFVDTLNNYIIEGNAPAAVGNGYSDTHIGKITIEDTSESNLRPVPAAPIQGQDHTDTSGLTFDEFGAGPWGSGGPAISVLSYSAGAQFGNNRYNFQSPLLSYSGGMTLTTSSGQAATSQLTVMARGSGGAAGRVQITNAASNYFAVTAASTLICADASNYFFFCKDQTSGGMTMGLVDNTLVTVTTFSNANTVTGINFALNVSGLFAKVNSGATPRYLSIFPIGVG